MKAFILVVAVLFTLNNTIKSQCASLSPISLPFIEDFESYSDTLSGIDTLYCNIDYRWTFNSSTPNGRAMCGHGSPVKKGGNGAVTFDVNDFNVFNTNELILTLNLSNYTLTDPIYLSFDCNNVADEPHLEDRIYIRGSETSTWIEVYNWSLLPANIWKSERENIHVANLLNNNGQNFSSSFQVKFSQKDNYGYSSDGFAIDNIAIEVVTCPKAQNFVLQSQNQDTAILSWLGSVGNNWNIQYGLKGFTLGQGTIVQSSNTSDTITQLLNNSIYEFYIQSNCGNNDLSIWEGPLKAYTQIINDSSCNAIFVEPSGNTIKTHNYNTGLQFSEAFVLNNSPKNTIWYKTIVPSSGHLVIETCQSSINTGIGAYYNPSICSDLTTFNQIAIASFSTPSSQRVCSFPGKAAVELCNLPPGDTILFWIGSYSAAIEGEIYFSVSDYSVVGEAGNPILDTLELCVTDTTNLFNNIENYNHLSKNWSWNYNANPNAIHNDTLLINGLTTYNSDLIRYIVSNTCSADTTAFSINVNEANYAGSSIVGLEFCNTSSIYLFSGITGLAETNGVWQNSNGETLNSAIYYPTESDFGNYEFNYIVNSNICKADTTTLNFEILNCTSIDETTLAPTLIYPNPNNGVFNFKTDKSSQILIFDLTGKIITQFDYETPNENHKIDLLHLQKGTYVIKTITNLKSENYKFIIY